ncbi:TIGR01457 family HAD-type hydrolase [Cerasibacillus terrae]|uniref:Acid sugar phosphatase n=1 Tax=Cerasibacillus terrae TaxID=2498845 RepID=A0A5C8NHW9_9BACI|nr:TIGR01457 family HAD-type hydrolase [Cerasibacillus terrae]TXL58138.1 TIGR01457 family HAD-type hydrolase [Cerasibacillus terrae]
MKTYGGYIIDLDGTMYRGNQVIDDAPQFIQGLVEKNRSYVFLTNNSTRTQEQVASKLNAMGIQASPEQICTTSMATAKYIKKQKKDARCYVIGESGLSAAIQEEGLQLVHNENCDYVIVGLDREITYEKLAIGCLAIQQGAVFISTNSDVAIPSENGLLPGNGSLTSVLTVATGKQPTFIGKPEKIIVEEALRLLGIKPEDTLIVGDNYETDIKAGIAANIDTLMVFTGVTPYEKYEKLSKKPTYHVKKLQEWMKNI